jgi:phosphoenolpyruvate-protein phosphotransferase (PTS system enzyme I)
VVGLGRFLDRAQHCRMAIIDGDEGLVILDPDLETQERYRKTAAERAAWFEILTRQNDLPAETADGTRIDLWGNIEFGGEVEACLERGATGVGLFRTEFLFLNAVTPPSEEQQFEVYSSVVRSMRGRPIVIRTLDLGADKLPHYRDANQDESNPALGLRSLRLSLSEPGLFRPQLRALLRASALGELRILFPLVSTLAELRAARAVLDDVAAELLAEGHAVRDKLPVGIMVEVPAAALMADHLAKEVDFFSIGTNDLIQYTLAVDRTNETVADLYCAADPAVLRLIAMVVDAAQSHGIEVSVCGTMGGEPLYAMLLLGLGLRHLSMPPHQLPEIKRLIRGMRIEAARQLAADVLLLKTAEEVVERLTCNPAVNSRRDPPIEGLSRCWAVVPVELELMRSAPPLSLVRRPDNCYYCTRLGKPLRTISIPNQATFCLTIDDGEKVGEPEIVARLKKRARIGLEPQVRSSAVCASAGYDRIYQSASPICEVRGSPPGQPS